MGGQRGWASRGEPAPTQMVAHAVMRMRAIVHCSAVRPLSPPSMHDAVRSRAHDGVVMGRPGPVVPCVRASVLPHGQLPALVLSPVGARVHFPVPMLGTGVLVLRHRNRGRVATGAQNMCAGASGRPGRARAHGRSSWAPRPSKPRPSMSCGLQSGPAAPRLRPGSRPPSARRRGVPKRCPPATACAACSLKGGVGRRRSQLCCSALVPLPGAGARLVRTPVGAPTNREKVGAEP
jgi:hypothetical protein